MAAILIAAIMLLSFAGLWWLFAATVVVNQEQAIMYLPWPLILGLALVLGAPWLWAETRRAGWWPLSPVRQGAPAAGPAIP